MSDLQARITETIFILNSLLEPILIFYHGLLYLVRVSKFNPSYISDILYSSPGEEPHVAVYQLPSWEPHLRFSD